LLGSSWPFSYAPGPNPSVLRWIEDWRELGRRPSPWFREGKIWVPPADDMLGEFAVRGTMRGPPVGNDEEVPVVFNCAVVAPMLCDAVGMTENDDRKGGQVLTRITDVATYTP